MASRGRPLRDLLSGLRGSIRHGTAERRLDEEIGFHVDMQTAKNIRLGMSPDAARREALLRFGGREQVKERARDAYRHRPIENVLQDLRYAIRALRSAPAYSTAAVLALGIGMGAVTGVFSLLDAVVLRPLPYAHPERLVMLWETNTDKSLSHEPVSPVNFVDYRGLHAVFEDAAAWWRPEIDLTDEENGDPIRIAAVETSGNLFRVLGVRPLLGSGFTMDSSLRGATSQVIVSHGLWQSRFAGSASIVGRGVRMNGTLFTIVGVMPPGFGFPGKTEAWQLLQWSLSEHSRRAHFMESVARLAPGVEIDGANRALAGLTTRLAADHRETNLGWGARAIRLDREIEGNFRPALFALFAASALLLAIACINVANLMIARATARRREVAVRTAIGATGQRIVVLFLAESLVLAAGGALVGLAIGTLCVKGLLAWSPIEIPRVEHIAIDFRVLLFAVVAALATALAFGLGPALHMSRAPAGEALRDGAKGSQSGGRTMRNALVIAQVALAVVLLSGAGLVIRSVSKLLRQDVGVDATGVLTGDVQLPGGTYKDWHQVGDFYARLLQGLRSRPEIVAAGATNFLPLEPGWRLPLTVAGAAPVAKGDEPTVQYQTVDDGYFATMHIAVVGGRVFDDRDRLTSPGVAIINETLARELFPGQDAIGKHVDATGRAIGPLGYRLTKGDDHEIVGVVRDVRNNTLQVAPEPAVYFAETQFPFRSLHIVIRGHGDATQLATVLRDELRSANPTLSLADVKPMSRVLSASLDPPRFVMVLLTVFAILALTLASVGIYGILTYVIGHRRHEIGIRLALGERPRDVVRMVVRQGLGLVIAGCLIGSVCAIVAARSLGSLLYDVAPGDPATTVGVVAVVIAVAMVACVIPGYAASALDPGQVLRAE